MTAHPTPPQGTPVTVGQVAGEWAERCGRLEAELEAWGLALQKYGRHLPYCRAGFGSAASMCTCGFDAARSRHVPR